MAKPKKPLDIPPDLSGGTGGFDKTLFQPEYYRRVVFIGGPYDGKILTQDQDDIGIYAVVKEITCKRYVYGKPAVRLTTLYFYFLGWN